MDNLDPAEEQLVALVRDKIDGVTSFSVGIRRFKDGRFAVSHDIQMQDDENTAGWRPAFGSGATFADAWSAAGAIPEQMRKDKTFTIALDASLVRALNKWIDSQQRATLTVEEAGRAALRDWLTGMGMLDRSEYPENTH